MLTQRSLTCPFQQQPDFLISTLNVGVQHDEPDWFPPIVVCLFQTKNGDTSQSVKCLPQQSLEDPLSNICSILRNSRWSRFVLPHRSKTFYSSEVATTENIKQF